MYIKVLAVIGFVAVASAKDLTVGVDGGRIIYEQNVTASPAIWRQVHYLTVTANTTDEVISQVVVIDNRPEKDGEVKVVEGGEGQENVTIELKSPAVFRGYDFSIQVFAAPGNVYLKSQTPKNPVSTGLDTQNAQVPHSKDFNLNQGQNTKNVDDIIRQGSKPTASSTEATKENKNDANQDKINPALVGQEQTRLNRDTNDHKTNEQVPVHTTLGSVKPTKNINTNANTDKKTQAKLDDDFNKTITSIFSGNSAQKTEDSKNVQVQSIHPQKNGSEDKLDLAHSDDQQKTVHGTEKDSAVPVLNKEQKDDVQSTSTPKNNLSSTTPRNIEGQEKLVPKVIPVSGEDFSSTHAPELSTQGTKLPKNDQQTVASHHLKGHHVEQKHAVPLPYANY